MSIFDQLSLSKNGGVYYEGIRMNPSKDAFLFVGLGGTGADALLRIKNEIKKRMHLKKVSQDGTSSMLDIPSNMALLAIDTDERTVNEANYGIASFDKYGREYIDISINDLTEVYADILAHHKNNPLWNWLDSRLKVANIKHGAGMIRQVGRMMLIRNYASVEQKIKEALAKLHETEPENTNIILVTGIAGGTGSGTFLDISFLLRYFAKKIGLPKTQMLGYIILPDLNAKNGGEESILYTNGFASLKELEYWMCMGDHGENFVQQYDETFTLTADRPPFDFCHLISAQDLEGHPVSYSDALVSLAENLFGYCVEDKSVDSEGNTAVVSMYSNIDHSISAIEKPYPASYRYLSIGASKLEIPYTEITTLIAARIFEKLSPTFAYTPTKDTFISEQRRMGLTDADLRAFVQNGVAESPIKKRKFKYNDVWGGSNKVEALVENYHSTTQIKIRTNSSNLSQEREGRVRTELKTLMASANRGPCYVAKLIYSNTSYSLINTLRGLRIQYADLEMQEGRNQDNYIREANEAFIDGMNCRLQKNKKLQIYLDAIRKYDESRFLWYMYGDLKIAVESLVKRLEVYYNKILKPLDDILQLLPGIFTKNHEYIETAHANNEWLISPVQFELDNEAVIQRNVDESYKDFLNRMTNNLSLWIGCELDNVDSKISGTKKADIPGFISSFIQDHFKATLQMSVEDLIKRKIKAGETFDNSVYSLFTELSNDAVPMYRPSSAHDNIKKHRFGFVSIPDICTEQFFTAAGNFSGLVQINVKFKKSGEHSKISFVNVIAGMPLYSYAIMQDMESAYENAYKHGDASAGIHLKDSWREEMTSPIPEATWSPGYKCIATKKRNEKNRKLFMKCLESGVIRYSEVEKTARLYLADENDIQGIDLGFDLPFSRRMEILTAENSRLWNNEFIKLYPCGTYLQTTEGMIANIRENAIRFYSLCNLIKEQCELFDRFSLPERKLMHTKWYAYALMFKMIQKEGGKRVFRKAIEDIRPRVLLGLSDLEHYRRYYAEFKSFSKGLSESEIENIEKRRHDVYNKLVKDVTIRTNTIKYVTYISDKMLEFAKSMEEVMSYSKREDLPKYMEERRLYLDISEIAKSFAKIIENIGPDDESDDFDF